MGFLPDRIAKLNVVRPTLLLDVDRAKRNIGTMVEKAIRSGVHLRPHAKTHQSAEIASWFREFGIHSLTVSSLEMALYFAENCCSDITVAFPANIRELDVIHYLSHTISLNLLVDHETVVDSLEKAQVEGVGIWVKVDVGYRRAGLSWQNPERIAVLARRIEVYPGFKFSGLLTHFGQSYHARGSAEISAVYHESLARLQGVQHAVREGGISSCPLSIGDTPTSLVIDDFTGVDEIRPGNFVFSDLMQMNIGAATAENLALAVACPVVSVYPERGEFIIYGGAVHFSKDSLEIDGQRIFGRLAALDERGWIGPRPDTAVVSLSQEHGIVRAPAEDIDALQPGDLVVILPVHACLTADMHGEYLTLDGDLVRRFSKAS